MKILKSKIKNLNADINPSNLQKPLYRKKIKIERPLPSEPRELLKTYPCTSCPAVFSRVAKLRLHTKTHLAQKVYHSEKYKGSVELPESEKLSGFEKKKGRSLLYKCLICNAAVVGNSRFRKHMRIHNGERPFCCNECGATFVQSCHLSIHKRTHTGEKPYQCTVCKQAFKQISHLRSHERIHTQTKPFSCEQCGASFIQKSSLNRHMKIHTGEKPHTCSVCFVKFGHKNNLDRHTVAKHCNNQPFSCKECGATFFQSSDLKRHILSHTGTKPYKCEECQATFSRSNALKCHQFIHIGETPFECDKCPAKFTNPRELRKHHIIHEQSEVYSCSVCPKKFRHSVSLEKHKTKHFDSKPVACPICLTTFKTNISLKKHMFKHSNHSVDEIKRIKKIDSSGDLDPNKRMDSKVVKTDEDTTMPLENIPDTNTVDCQPQYMAFQVQDSNLLSSIATGISNQNLYQPNFAYSASTTTILPIIQPQLPTLVLSPGTNNMIHASSVSDCANKLYAMNSSNNLLESLYFCQVPVISTPAMHNSNVPTIGSIGHLLQRSIDKLNSVSGHPICYALPPANVQVMHVPSGIQVDEKISVK